jgi:excisionase family DNA binding protein
MEKVAAPRNRLWSVEETAYYLGISINTLYYWRSEGRGPASRRVGRHLRYRAADVESWVVEQPGWCTA